MSNYGVNPLKSHQIPWYSHDIPLGSHRISGTSLHQDPQWEDTCTDSWGYSWCTPKTYPCPIECGDGEQARDFSVFPWLSHGFLHGFPRHWVCLEMGYTRIPPSRIQMAIKNSGNWWLTTGFAGTRFSDIQTTPHVRPIEPWLCQVCHSYTYLPTGEPDWSVPHNQSCAPWNGSCPCHPQFEDGKSKWSIYFPHPYSNPHTEANRQKSQEPPK